MSRRRQKKDTAALQITRRRGTAEARAEAAIGRSLPYMQPQSALLVIPNEILQRIVGMVSRKLDRQNLRLTCKRLRDVNDSVVMHNFRTHRHLSCVKTCYVQRLYAVLKVACTPYIDHGCFNIFCGLFLSVFHNSFRSRNYGPLVGKVNSFFNRFFNLVERQCHQNSSILYLVTLESLLKYFNKNELIYETRCEKFYERKIEYVVQDVWLRNNPIYRVSIPRSRVVKRADLIIQLVFLKLFSNQEPDFFDRSVLVGKRPATNKREMSFRFCQWGSTKMLEFFESVTRKSILDDEIPEDNFLVNIEISSLNDENQMFRQQIESRRPFKVTNLIREQGSQRFIQVYGNKRLASDME